MRSGAAGSVLIDELEESPWSATASPSRCPSMGSTSAGQSSRSRSANAKAAHLARSLQRLRRPLSPVAPRGRSRTFGLLVGAAACCSPVRSSTARSRPTCSSARRCERRTTAAAGAQRTPTASASSTPRRSATRRARAWRAAARWARRTRRAGWSSWRWCAQVGPDWPRLGAVSGAARGRRRAGASAGTVAPELTRLSGHDTRVEVRDALLARDDASVSRAAAHLLRQLCGPLFPGARANSADPPGARASRAARGNAGRAVRALRRRRRASHGLVVRGHVSGRCRGLALVLHGSVRHARAAAARKCSPRAESSRSSRSLRSRICWPRRSA